MNTSQLTSSPKPNKNSLHLLNLFVDGLIAIIIILAVFLAYGTIPNRWYHVLYVYSGSMAPAIRPGDLIVVTPPTPQLKPGMIITLSVNGELVTHRLVAIRSDGSLETKGDANSASDGWQTSDIQVRGIYRGRIPLLGYIVTLPKQLLKIGESGAWFSDSDQVTGELSTSNWLNSSAPPPPSSQGTTIEATIEALPFFVRFPDQPGMDSFGVEVKICTANTGGSITQDLKVEVGVEYKLDSGEFSPLEAVGTTVIATEQLEPGHTECFPFTLNFMPKEGIQYRAAAKVTITNYSGWQSGGPNCAGLELCPYGQKPKQEFAFDDVFVDEPGSDVVEQPEPSPTEIPTLEITVAPTEVPTVEPSPTPIPTLPPDAMETVIPSPEPSPTPTESGIVPTP